MTTPAARGPGARAQPPSGPFAEGEPAEGSFSPRLALLALVLYNPVILVGYLVYLYGPVNSCMVGPLCSFDQLPGILQVPLLLASALLLWLLLAVLLQRAIETEEPRKPAFFRALAAISDHRRVHDLLLVYGSLLAAALVLGLVRHTMTPAALVLGGYTALVCWWVARSGRQRGPASPSAQPPPAPPGGANATGPQGAVSAWPVRDEGGTPTGETAP